MPETTIEIQVTENDVHAAVVAFVDGARLEAVCPLAAIAQQHLERQVRVFTHSWHLAKREKVPATRGVSLPPAAVAFVAAFDSWAQEVKRRVEPRVDHRGAKQPGMGLEQAITETKGRPRGIRVELVLPTQPIGA